MHKYEWAELVDSEADETMNLEICECGHVKGDPYQPHETKTYEKNVWLEAHEEKMRKYGLSYERKS